LPCELHQQQGSVERRGIILTGTADVPVRIKTRCGTEFAKNVFWNMHARVRHSPMGNHPSAAEPNIFDAFTHLHV